MLANDQVLGRSKEQGLTLVEVMLSLTIMAMVMSTVYGSFRVAGHSLQGLSVRNELYRSTHALLDEIGRELISAYLSSYGLPLNGRAITYFFVEDKESYEMPQDDLFFTTYAHASSMNATGESGQSEVCYTVRYSTKRDELVLLKKEDTTLDEETCRDETLDDWDQAFGERLMPVATGIHPEKGNGYRLVGFNIECFGKVIDEPIFEWNSDEKRLLPHQVRVTITYKDWNDQLLPFSKTIAPQLMQR